MKRTAALVAVLALLGVTVWLVWPSVPEVRGQAQRITVVDGPSDDQRVELDVTFFPPPGGGRAPAVLLAHGFGGSKRSVRAEATELARQGYAVLTWSARGFGGSTGEIALNSPDYEVKDVKQLIDWLAGRPEVLLDAAGDPRVGITGASYGGAIALLTAAHDPRVDAIVPQITWSDLGDALFPDAAGGGPANGVFKRMWAGIFFGQGGAVQSGAAEGLEALTRPAAADDRRAGAVRPLPALDLRDLPGRRRDRQGHPGGRRAAQSLQPGPRGGPRQGADAAHPGPARLAVPARPRRRERQGHRRCRHARLPGLVRRRP
ncbi:alpha/beta hydrolase [Nonomuraea ferruginea]|uniref:alpha/beta hydrolase n=1 Tax=Nonomuraea ferruginea TaxID=46174 RepID=UPI003618A61B